MTSRTRKRKIQIDQAVKGNSASDNNILNDAIDTPPKAAKSGPSVNVKEISKPNQASTSKDVCAKTSKTNSKQTDEVAKNGKKLTKSFFQRQCSDLAQALLGTTLVRKLDNGDLLRGMIVETEAYLGEHDKAAHSYKLKRTERNAAMFMDPGTIYVYHIYGMYTCINISSEGDGCAVLVRAVDPFDSCVDVMKKLRSKKRKDGGKSLKAKDLGSGPSKLTQAFDIDKPSFNQKHVCEHEKLWLESGDDVPEADVIACARIGVDYAEEWAKKPLRFYVLGNRSISVRDKAKEQNAENKTSKYFS